MKGVVEGRAVHVGFVAIDTAADNGAPGARLHYDPRYYAVNVLDPDGYSLEFVHKSWQPA